MRREAIDGALLALLEVGDTSRVSASARVVERLAGVASKKRLKSAARLLFRSLPTDVARLELQVRLAKYLHVRLPAVAQVMRRLPSDQLRLEALLDFSYEVPNHELIDAFAEGLDTFTDPNSRAAGCLEVLRRWSRWTGDGPLAEAQLTRVLDIAATASDSAIRSELLGYLDSAVSESSVERVCAAKLELNSRLLDAEERARAMFAAISLLASDGANAEFARLGLEATAEITDNALQVALLGQYVASIPGTPPWKQDLALAIANGIQEERLGAKALGSILALDSVALRALESGLAFTDPWARASVIFAWEGWRPAPDGSLETEWKEIRRKAAYAYPRPRPEPDTSPSWLPNKQGLRAKWRPTTRGMLRRKSLILQTESRRCTHLWLRIWFRGNVKRMYMLQRGRFTGR